MRFPLKVALACLLSLVCIQQIFCDELSAKPGSNNWTCICSSSYQAYQSSIISKNCSASCDCTPREVNGNKWICICGADRFPKVDAQSFDCFTACNCSSDGFSSTDLSQPSKKGFSGKFIVIILLICVVITAIASIASFSCYVHTKNKRPIKRPLFSSDKLSSFNSTTNLINHMATSPPEYSLYVGSPDTRMAGCFYKSSSFFRSRTQMIRGTITQFTYTELENATNKFSNSNLIGLGGSSQVYCGHLKDGRIVAIKRIIGLGGPDDESVFATEIEVISRLHHCHVVPLLGYCSEYQGKHQERLLVFEYMANGDLRACLDAGSGKSLDWITRVSIALGAARGLEYLHEAAAPRILHRDVKSTNILLDENWRAKITDLGMAKRLKSDGVTSCTNSPARMQGTFGYFAPEYSIIGRASLMSDVFSFGVVLLELITGRQPIHKSADKRHESLVIWAMPRLQDSKRVISELPDPLLKGKFPEEEMQIMAYLAKECLLMDPDLRPTMSEVVQTLSTIVSDNSGRRNFHLNVFQSFSTTHGPKTELQAELTDERIQVKNPVVVEELRRMTSNTWSPRCSLPLNIDRNICLENKDRVLLDTPSAEYVDRVILLPSNARNCQNQEEEGADLTEPRFESFHVATIRTPS